MHDASFERAAPDSKLRKDKDFIFLLTQRNKALQVGLL